MDCSPPDSSVHGVLQQDYWSGLPFPPPGDLPDQGSNPRPLCLLHFRQALYPLGFPRGSDGTASAYNAGDPGSIPGLGRSSGGGNDSPLQYSCLENPVDREACWATVRGGSNESDTAEQLHFLFFLFYPLSLLGSLVNSNLAEFLDYG